MASCEYFMPSGIDDKIKECLKTGKYRKYYKEEDVHYCTLSWDKVCEYQGDFVIVKEKGKNYERWTKYYECKKV